MTDLFNDNDRFSISAPIVEDLLEKIRDSIGGKPSPTPGGDVTPMESITYAELVEKRNSGSLTAGMQYRITDYECTVVSNDGNARAISHPFDVIVVADGPSTLNENARACLHEGDTYYSAKGSSANLAAWELKYDLDNDTTKYAWADATNGKGVIYWMKDEKNNECPYDFKQIQFKRYKITESVVESLVGKYSVLPEEKDTRIMVNMDDPVWCYTFNGLDDNTGSATEVDTSITSVEVVYNAMKPGYNYDTVMLNNNVMFGYSCHHNTFVGDFSSNTFGKYCSSNIFGDACYSNTFGNRCNSNAFGKNCNSNTFGNECSSNAFGDACSSNIFGDACSSNIFEDACSSNAFGKNCSSNTFGNRCSFNAFEKNCNFNTFGGDCSSNIFGDACYSNAFGKNCNSNTFRNECSFITFGDRCSFITSDGPNVSNYYILNNVSGTSKTPYTITAGTNNGQVTYVGKTSDGTIKQWVPADMVL